MAATLFGRWLDAGATFDPNRIWRYRLWRIWSEVEPAIGFCMLNPSTADESVDDPTIRRCIGFARAWGYGGVVIVNLFALRSTDPKALAKHPDPIGPDNDAYLSQLAETVPLIIAAWGVHGKLLDRQMQVRTMLHGKLWHLGLTRDGAPKHPLYLAAGTERQQWR